MAKICSLSIHFKESTLVPIIEYLPAQPPYQNLCFLITNGVLKTTANSCQKLLPKHSKINYFKIPDWTMILVIKMGSRE